MARSLRSRAYISFNILLAPFRADANAQPVGNVKMEREAGLRSSDLHVEYKRQVGLLNHGLLVLVLVPTTIGVKAAHPARLPIGSDIVASEDVFADAGEVEKRGKHHEMAEGLSFSIGPTEPLKRQVPRGENA